MKLRKTCWVLPIFFFFSTFFLSFSEPVSELSRDGDNPLFWFLPDSVMGRDFSMFTTVLSTDFQAEKDAKFGYPGDRFGPTILRFVREGGEIVLQQVSGFVPQLGEPLDSLWEERYNRLEHRRFPILNIGRGGVIIDVSEWVKDDWFFGLHSYSFLLKTGPLKEWGKASVIRTEGQIIVRSEVTYSPLPMPGVPQVDSKWVIGTCLTLLPEQRMESVKADRRVGYFNAPAVESDGISLHRTQVLRKFRNGVTFHVYPDFPQRLLPALRGAVQSWDRVFQDYGLQGRVSLVEPTAAEVEAGVYKVDDARLSWIKYNNAPFNENAYGRGYTDVRTGEVLCGCLGIFSGVDRNLRRWYATQTGDSGPMPEDVYMALFEMVVTHEIGHILGLVHNFYGSRQFSVAQLKDSALMSKVSHGSSIMDYMRMNFAAEEGDGIKTVDRVPVIGPYDRAAMVWGYGDETALRSYWPESQGIASACLRSEFAKMMFAADSLRYLPESTWDPQTMAEDLSSEPLAAARIGMKHLERLCSGLSPDSTFIINAAYKQYSQYVDHAITFFGGRVRIEGESRPVDSPALAEATAFLEDYAYNPPLWAQPVLGEDFGDMVRAKVKRRMERSESSRRTAAGFGEQGDRWDEGTSWENLLSPKYPTIVNIREEILAADSVYQAIGYKLIREDNAVFLLSRDPYELTVTAQIDGGGGMDARPLPVASAFTDGGLADITAFFAGIFSSEYVTSSYGLTFRSVRDMLGEVTVEPYLPELSRKSGSDVSKEAARDCGWIVRMKVNFGYSPKVSVVEMLPRTGTLPLEVTLFVRGEPVPESLPEDGNSGGLKHRLRLSGTDTVYVSRLVPETYLKRIRKELRRVKGRKIRVEVCDELSVLHGAGISYDILDTRVFSDGGFLRLNIGARSSEEDFEAALARFSKEMY